MPRTGRLHIPGGCYHVMGRGLERRKIFASEVDRQDFVDRLARGLAETDIRCLAWAVMPNHYHLLLRVGPLPLSDLMRKLLSGFATTYNRRHRRVGYVFQNRFKSILCDEETYLLALLAYIHLNPVRGKVVPGMEALGRYKWTGHAALMGNLDNEWQSTAEILRRFGKRSRSARKAYEEFVTRMLSSSGTIDLAGGGLIRSYGGWEAARHARRDHERKIGDERILGDSEFVNRVLSADSLQIEASTYLEGAGWDLERLIASVCRQFGIDNTDITRKGRRNTLSHARSVICFLSRHELRLSVNEIGPRLQMKRSAVSEAVSRGKAYCEKEGLTIKRLARLG